MKQHEIESKYLTKLTQYWEALCVVFAKFLVPIRKIFRRVRAKTLLPFETAAILLVTRLLRFP